MAKGKASGISLTNENARVVLAMDKRGDRDHDIAAWFGVNQGRIAEVKGGSHGPLEPWDGDLPPKGPPGLKGRRLRGKVTKAIEAIDASATPAEVKAMLSEALAVYNANEA